MSSGDADRKLLFATLALWLGVLALYWPRALSFADEVGYLGQAKLLLAGQLRPTRLDPGIWLPGPHGLTGKYALQLPVLIAPLLALSPSAVFAIGVASALALTQLAARQLRDWGRRPLWALLLLAHPTLVIMARTVMADVLLSAVAVAAWAALRRGRGDRGAVRGPGLHQADRRGDRGLPDRRRDRAHPDVLALTEQAFKAGLLYAGRTRVFDPSTERVRVALCSATTWSHRAPVAHASCEFDGYRSAARVDDFEVLVLAPSGDSPRR